MAHLKSHPPRQIVAVEANTPEWHKWRATVRTASQSALIMGVYPYSPKLTWDDLRERKCPMLCAHECPELDGFTRHLFDRGHRMETEWLKAHLLRPRPVCLQRGDYSASLDGHIDDPLGFQWWEIKTVRDARSRMWRYQCSDTAMLKADHPHVWWQLVHQAHVVGDPMAICLLVVVLDASTWWQMRVPVAELLADWAALCEQWEQYAAGGQPGLADDAWLTAAAEYLAAKEAADLAAETLKQARAKVLGLAAEQDDKAVGGGIQVITSSRQGAIDYKTMANDLSKDIPNFDQYAERYRRPDFPIQSIRKTS